MSYWQQRWSKLLAVRYCLPELIIIKMGKSIKGKFISGVVWSSISRFTVLGIQFLVTLILARKLSPGDFGTIGLLNVFLALSQILLDSGFGDAIIQKESRKQIDYSSVFYINIIVGIICYVILYATSPLLDKFYRIDSLHEYARILFLIIPINALGLIQKVQLRQDLEFYKMSIIEIVSALLSGILGVYMAYDGYGIYSIIAQMVSINILRTISVMLINKWMPSFVFSIQSIKPLFNFGINLTLTSLLTVIFNNIYTIIIGRCYDPKSVGYYNQADQYERLSANTITEIVMGVSFPTLVKFKDDIDRLREAYSKIIESVIFIVAPMMLYLFVISEDLFVFLLTDKWAPASPYFKILCIYGVTFPLHQINGNVLKVLGKGKQYFKIELLRRTLIIVSICITINISIIALIYGQIISMMIIIAVSMKLAGKYVNFPIKRQILDVLPYYINAIISAFFTFAIVHYYGQGRLYNIILSAITMVLSYLTIARIFRLKALNSIILMIRK